MEKTNLPRSGLLEPITRRDREQLSRFFQELWRGPSVQPLGTTKKMNTEENPSMDIMKILLEFLEYDRKHVMLYVAICFAVPTFTLSNIKILDAPLVTRIFLFISLSSFIIGGMGYFFYTRKIHHKRFKGIQNIMELDPEALRKTLFGVEEGVWAEARKFYNIGKVSLIIASNFYIIFFITLIFKKELFS